MSNPVQPSNDATATAIAVAGQIVERSTIPSDFKEKAKLIGEMAKLILDGLIPSSQPPQS
jgi:hypothetical protein